jgi:hypothetical protein
MQNLTRFIGRWRKQSTQQQIQNSLYRCFLQCLLLSSPEFKKKKEQYFIIKISSFIITRHCFFWSLHLRFHNISTWASLKRHNLSKCASGASKLLSYEVYVNYISTFVNPVRIRVRIDPPHPLVCRKRWLNRGGPSDETGKPRPRVTAGVAR